MKLKLYFLFPLSLILCPFAVCQTPPSSGSTQGSTLSDAKLEQAQRDAALKKVESIKKIGDTGIEVRIKDIARFRGIRSNQLLGYGLIVGLEGSGDSKSTPFTQTLLANAMKSAGTIVDPAQLKVKNVAVVAITAELPPFAAPGNNIDVTVQSIGDAKSLQGGTLLQSPLYAASSKETVFAVAQGPISIGGFAAGSGGASVQKNQLNVGRIPDGAIVENSTPTKFVFDNKMFLELDDADLTTAQRLATKLNEAFPNYQALPINGGTIQVTIPIGTPPISAMSLIEMTKVFADIPALVIINERTGTIVVGGNVRIGPALVAKGSLNVRIDKDLVISQPNAFAAGQTVAANQTTVKAEEDQVSVALLSEVATVADLARIFQSLKVSPTDIIAILQALRDQGALKARIKIQ
jgi:flagellar P-ring protein precursor FlgI